MKWAEALGIAAIILVMFLYEWPKIGRRWKREKTAFAALTILGGILALLLVFYPEMPGPTQWIDAMYKPLAKLLGKS